MAGRLHASATVGGLWRFFSFGISRGSRSTMSSSTSSSNVDRRPSVSQLGALWSDCGCPAGKELAGLGLHFEALASISDGFESLTRTSLSDFYFVIYGQAAERRQFCSSRIVDATLNR